MLIFKVKIIYKKGFISFLNLLLFKRYLLFFLRTNLNTKYKSFNLGKILLVLFIFMIINKKIKEILFLRIIEQFISFMKQYINLFITNNWIYLN